MTMTMDRNEKVEAVMDRLSPSERHRLEGMVSLRRVVSQDLSPSGALAPRPPISKANNYNKLHILDDADDTALSSLLNSSISHSNLMEQSVNDVTVLRRVVSDECLPRLTSQSDVKAVVPLFLNDRVISPSKTSSKHISCVRHFTELAALICEKKYADANRRVREKPGEAFTWITSEQFSTSPKLSKCIALPSSPSILEEQRKRLPIHIACANLATASESKQRFQLEQLILKLALTFPESCSFMDHNGQSPLLLAIWNNATPETISMLLMSHPPAIYHRDSCGRTPVELNRHRSGIFAEQVKDLLTMGIAFWEEARRKAADRFRSPKFASTPAGIATSSATYEPQPLLRSFRTISKEGDDYPDSSLTVDDEEESESSLLSETVPKLLQEQKKLSAIYRNPALSESATMGNIHDSYCIPSSESHYQNFPSLFGGREKEPDSRAKILQDMLSDMYERNHKLHNTIKQLNEMNSNLQKQIKGNEADFELEPLVIQLREEKMQLLKTIESQQKDAPFLDGIDEDDRPFDELAQDSVCGDPHATGNDTTALCAQNNALKLKVSRLRAKRSKQSEKIQYLKSIIACTGEDLLTDLSSETESFSTFSMLDSITTDPALRTGADDYSSTASSFRRRLASSSGQAAESTKEEMQRQCLITGLASYRFRDFTARLQQKVRLEKYETKPKYAVDPDGRAIADNIDEICGRAAKLYAEHVKECSWRNGQLVLKWEPSAVIKRTLDPPALVERTKDIPKQRAEAINLSEQRESAVPMVIPVRYRTGDINNELGSIVSYSETSLSSIGMRSLNDNLWI